MICEDDGEKRYQVYKKVVAWEEWVIWADSHGEAIKKVYDEEGDFIEVVTEDIEYLEPDADGFVRFEEEGATVEMYHAGELVWDNKPISVKREEKLKELGL